jgi:hypothetical protein
MRDTPVGETTEDLLGAARARGFDLTARQIAEWHRDRIGLLPRPTPRWRGRKGSESVYPPGTVRQLLALCAFRREDRHVPHIAWRLWWAGYPVRGGHVRALLGEVAADWAVLFRCLRQWAGEDGASSEGDEDLIGDVIDAGEQIRLVDHFLAQARRRVGRKQFPTVMGVMASVVAGAFEGYGHDREGSEEVRALVETALGLRPPRTVGRRRKQEGARPWFTGDTEAGLRDVSRMFREHPPGQELDRGTDAELAQARDEVKAVLTMWVSLASLVDESPVHGVREMSGFARALGAARPKDQASALLLWRIARASTVPAEVEALLSLARQAQPPAPNGAQAAGREATSE